MADNLGKQGGSTGAHEAKPVKGGKPETKVTGSFPTGECHEGSKPSGHGGSKRGAK